MKNKFNCGIVTFHRAHNYGAVLQAYALKKVISDLDYKVGFIDEQHDSLKFGYELYPSISSIKNFRKLLSYFKRWIELALDFKRKKKRDDAFNNFIKENIPLVNSKFQTQIDSIVVGSDQVWNTTYTEGVEPLYLGEPKNILSKKIVSYAASMGVSTLNKDEISLFSDKLKNFSAISVRERGLQSFLENIGFPDTLVTLDPTLLLEKSEWKEIKTNSINSNDCPYLLIYEVHKHPSTFEVADKIAKKLNLKIKILAPKVDRTVPKGHITNASPGEFLELFSKASYIVTTSFHGTVFSIINEKKFLTMTFGNDVDIRSKNLLNSLNLESRADESKCFEDICYAEVNDKLNVLKSLSIDFLDKNLRS